jgi:transcriptional regulator with XRE-family HTH domain
VPDARLNDLINAIRYAAMPFVYDWEQSDDAPEVIAKRRAAMDLERARLKDRRAHLVASTKENNLLTAVTVSGNIPPVKSTMASLLDRLNEATSQRGMKSKLAKVMGVPLSNVSQWLSGEREPGGETTLRLLNWVIATEAKLESPGGVEAPPEPKTQVRKSGYEKQTQARKQG